MQRFLYNDLQKKTNLTPLMIASVYNRENMVDDLLFLGANVNELNSHEETALHLAFQEGNVALLEKLILAGGDLKAVSFSGNVVYENLHNLLDIPHEELTDKQQKMRSLAEKYAFKPLTAEEQQVIFETRENNQKRRVEGLSPNEMHQNAKNTLIAKFFKQTDKDQLLESLNNYIDSEKRDYETSLNNVLAQYPKSLKPTSEIKESQKGLIATCLLEKIDALLPKDSYLSDSWLTLQQISTPLNEGELSFIDSAKTFIKNHQSTYRNIQNNPTFSIIKKTGLANCGELADACLNDQKSDTPKIPLLKHLSFLRANIKVKPNLKNLPDHANKELQHVFLILEMGSNKRIDDMLSSLENNKTQSLDIWKRSAGMTKDLIVKHMQEAGVSYAKMELTHPMTGEKRHLELRYDSQANTLSVKPYNPATGSVFQNKFCKD